MCNSDFLDCKLKSQKFNYRFDSISWFYATLWYLKKEEIKKFVAFPGLTPLQPDAYAQPSKRASLSDHPHPSSLPTGRQESIKTK